MSEKSKDSIHRPLRVPINPEAMERLNRSILQMNEDLKRAAERTGTQVAESFAAIRKSLSKP